MTDPSATLAIETSSETVSAYKGTQTALTSWLLPYQHGQSGTALFFTADEGLGKSTCLTQWLTKLSEDRTTTVLFTLPEYPSPEVPNWLVAKGIDPLQAWALNRLFQQWQASWENAAQSKHLALAPIFEHLVTQPWPSITAFPAETVKNTLSDTLKQSLSSLGHPVTPSLVATLNQPELWCSVWLWQQLTAAADTPPSLIACLSMAQQVQQIWGNTLVVAWDQWENSLTWPASNVFEAESPLANIYVCAHWALPAVLKAAAQPVDVLTFVQEDPQARIPTAVESLFTKAQNWFKASEDGWPDLPIHPPSGTHAQQQKDVQALIAWQLSWLRQWPVATQSGSSQSSLLGWLNECLETPLGQPLPDLTFETPNPKSGLAWLLEWGWATPDHRWSHRFIRETLKTLVQPAHESDPQAQESLLTLVDTLLSSEPCDPALSDKLMRCVMMANTLSQPEQVRLTIETALCRALDSTANTDTSLTRMAAILSCLANINTPSAAQAVITGFSNHIQQCEATGPNDKTSLWLTELLSWWKHPIITAEWGELMLNSLQRLWQTMASTPSQMNLPVAQLVLENLMASPWAHSSAVGVFESALIQEPLGLKLLGLKGLSHYRALRQTHVELLSLWLLNPLSESILVDAVLNVIYTTLDEAPHDLTITLNPHDELSEQRQRDHELEILLQRFLTQCTHPHYWTLGFKAYSRCSFQSIYGTLQTLLLGGPPEHEGESDHRPLGLEATMALLKWLGTHAPADDPHDQEASDPAMAATMLCQWLRESVAADGSAIAPAEARWMAIRSLGRVGTSATCLDVLEAQRTICDDQSILERTLAKAIRQIKQRLKHTSSAVPSPAIPLLTVELT